MPPPRLCVSSLKRSPPQLGQQSGDHIMKTRSPETLLINTTGSYWCAKCHLSQHRDAIKLCAEWLCVRHTQRKRGRVLIGQTPGGEWNDWTSPSHIQSTSPHHTGNIIFTPSHKHNIFWTGTVCTLYCWW